MDNQFFQCSIRYDKTMENGLLKKVKEVFLVEALSYTEAEKRFIEVMTTYISGEFEVADIKRAHINELFVSLDAAADRWYKVKIAYITIDEKTGGEKRTPAFVLVQATDFNHAIKVLIQGMKGTLGDWCIVSAAETPILDIYYYTERGEPEYEE